MKWNKSSKTSRPNFNLVSKSKVKLGSIFSDASYTFTLNVHFCEMHRRENFSYEKSGSNCNLRSFLSKAIGLLKTETT